MIWKERNAGEHSDTDKFSKAGAEAEEKLSFYLRRAFGKSENIHVLNDLRLIDDSGDVAQLDHLVLHRHGFVIVESKSVSTTIQVNKNGEWTRSWNGRQTGMQSPVQQAKLQIELLRELLDEHRAELLPKALGLLQYRFGHCPFEIIVAISDHGTIKRGCKVDELVKADQVIDFVQVIEKRHHKAASLLSLKPFSTDGIYTFKRNVQEAICNFLLARHQPLRGRSMQPECPAAQADVIREEPAPYGQRPAPQTEPVEDQANPGLGQCENCGAQCMIKWGRYGYYWKCIECDTNMAIKEFCLSCGKKMKLRKDGKHYFKRCEPCGSEEMYCLIELVDDDGSDGGS